MKNILIIGANRGIGLELARVFSNDDYNVIATSRNIDDDAIKNLQDISDKIQIYQLDVRKKNQIIALKEQLKDTPIDILLINAGIMCRGDINQFYVDNMIEAYHVNAVAPTLIASIFQDNVKKSHAKKMVVISSVAGSIANFTKGSMLGYRASKSALNAFWHAMSFDLKEDQISVAMIHPGWVKTDMGGEEAPVLPQDSAAGIKQVIENIDINKTGSFWSFDGNELAW